MRAPSPETVAPPYQPLVILLAAVCAGIVVDRFGPLPVGVWWAAAGGGLAVSLALRWQRWPRAASGALLLAAAAAAASWHHCRWCLFDPDDSGFYARVDAEPACVEAVARQAPRYVPPPAPNPMRVIPVGERTRLDLDLVAIRDADRWRAVSGRTRLDVDGVLTGVAAGDRLQVVGQLSLLEGAQNPGEFDYADYLRADRVRTRLWVESPECVSVVARGRGWSPRRLIDATRNHGNELLRQWLAPERAALAAAVLLGAREGLDPDQTEAFVETGTVHLLAISGLHVGIVAGALLFLLRRAPIPRGWAVLATGALAVGYMLLADARPPVMRATVLVLVVCGAMYLRRPALSLNSLAAAGLVVLAVSPAELFHTGAQLSFLAVAALIGATSRWTAPPTAGDPQKNLLAQSRAWPVRFVRSSARWAWEITLAGAAIWLVTAPLVMARFHLFTPVAVLLNTAIWLPMSTALVSGFAALGLGAVAEPLGRLPGALCDKSLWLLQSSVDAARELPWGHVWVAGPPNWWLAGFYGGLGLLAAVPRLRPRRRWCAAMLVGWSAAGLAPRCLGRHVEQLDCTFLSVGHGCAVVIELPSGETVLYDAGSLGSPVAAARSIAGFLWSRGIDRLDAVVISHADADHYNALPRLLEQFSVGAVYVSPAMWDVPGQSLQVVERSIRESGVALREASAGQRLPIGGECVVEVLHPPSGGVEGSDNASSVVLDVRYRGRRILLPGDLESPGLDDLLAAEPADCDVLLVPHHGSRQSNPPGLAAWCTPEWVVISGSHNSDTRPLEAAYRAAGSRVFHTADTGAVGARIDATGVHVSGYLPIRPL